MRSILLLVAPIAIAAIILAAAGRRGISVFKRQGVAWGLTVLMVFAAIGIGYAKSSANNPTPEPGFQQGPGLYPSYVWDNAKVLSDRTVRELDERNLRLYDHYQASIGVVTCNYGGDDLYSYAWDLAEEMGLGGIDMIVVLDISGDNYYLLAGSDLARNFTDDDCSYYAVTYMEQDFARGNYDKAVLKLTQALEDWYDGYYYA